MRKQILLVSALLFSAGASQVHAVKPPALADAVMKGDLKALSKAKKADLVKVVDTDGNSLLHLAADRGDVKAVELLLKIKAPVKAANKYGNTPLHEAVSPKGPEGVQKGPAAEAYERHAKIINMLLAAGADPNAQNKSGDSPLHFLCRTSFAFPEAVRLLIQKGGKVNLKNKDGETPVDIYTNPVIPREMNSGMDAALGLEPEIKLKGTP